MRGAIGARSLAQAGQGPASSAEHVCRPNGIHALCFTHTYCPAVPAVRSRCAGRRGPRRRSALAPPREGRSLFKYRARAVRVCNIDQRAQMHAPNAHTLHKCTALSSTLCTVSLRPRVSDRHIRTHCKLRRHAGLFNARREAGRSCADTRACSCREAGGRELQALCHYLSRLILPVPWTLTLSFHGRQLWQCC